MSKTCSMCGPGAACHTFALMDEPGDWRGRLSGKTWPGPAGSYAFRVGGSAVQNWHSVASYEGWSPWDLIYYNFGTRNAREVNWYLYHFVGCRISNDGNKNLSFHHSNPGIIYTRKNLNPTVIPPPPEVVKPLDPLKPAGPKGPVVPKPMYTRGLNWVGFGLQGGGMGLFHGGSGAVAYMVNLEDVHSRFLLDISASRTGWGAGGSASIVCVAVTGLHDPSDIRYAPGGAVDFQFALGGKWGALAKNLKHVPNLKLLVNAARSGTHIKDFVALAKTVNSAKFALKAGGVDVTSNELKVTILELPIGAGYEGSLYWEDSIFRASNIILTPEPYELE